MINITNYTDHPTRENYVVFRFYEENRAQDFEQLLKEQELWYEFTKDESEEKILYLFGIRKSDFNQANRNNFLINAKYRKPFISNVFFKWLVLIVTGIFVAAAIAGFLKT